MRQRAKNSWCSRECHGKRSWDSACQN